MTNVPAPSSEPHGTFASYVVGFTLSVLLTFFAFWAASSLGSYAVGAVALAAVMQLLVQLVFFLHLVRGKSVSANLGVFMLTFAIIGVLVGGTLWIMYNLAHLHMPLPTTTQLYENGVVAPQNELK